MNTEVYESVIDFIKRAEEKSIKGSVCNIDDIRNLNNKLNGLLPQWYSELIESIKNYPGLEIFKKGYICIASDSTGGGDPYFIDTNAGDNPPVYRVYHDVSDNLDEILAKGRQLVSNSLSELFQSSIFD